jgi:tRNA (cmo5U34)-methyltransferase
MRAGAGLQWEGAQERKQPVMLSLGFGIFSHDIPEMLFRTFVIMLRRQNGEDWDMTSSSHAKFDEGRAGEYARQARIALAGYDACHELCACILSAALDGRRDASILVVGAGGTAGEIITTAKLEQSWTFVAVDPSEPMLNLARSRIDAEGLEGRVRFVNGDLATLPREPAFDGALMIGVLHHIAGDMEKAALLRETGARLKAGGSLILAGNYRPYASEPLLGAAWGRRWRLFGATREEADAKLATIISGAVPPRSEQHVAELLDAAGFDAPLKFFSSLFWGAWHARRR